MKNEEKAKVGRPKLADNDLKMNSIVLCMMSLVIVLSLMIGGIFSLTNIGSKKTLGAVSAHGVKSYCHYFVEDVKSNTAVMKWYCTDGRKLNNYVLSENGNKVEQRKSIDIFRKKSGAYQFNNLKSNTSYKITFTDSNSQTYNLSFKTLSGTSGTGKINTTVAYKPYMYISDLSNSTVKVSYRGFGATAGTYTIYNDLNCNKVVDSSESKSRVVSTKSISSSNDEIGSFTVTNLANNKCYVASINFRKEDPKTAGTLTQSNKNIAFKTSDSKFFIKYNANGGIGEMTNQIITYGYSVPLNENQFSRAGYTFKGWYLYSDGKWLGTDGKWAANLAESKRKIYSNKITVGKTVNPGKTVTMYAVWKSNSGSVPATTQKANSIKTTKSVTVSWTNSCSSKKSSSDCSGKISGDSKCIWRQNACHASGKVNFAVVFDGNGASGSMPVQKIRYSSDGKVQTPLAANKFTKSGYKFVGWVAMKTNGTIKACTSSTKCSNTKWLDPNNAGWVYKYADKQKIWATVSAGNTITMIAQWEKVESTVKNTLTLKCPSEAYVNEEFTCTTNMAGAKFTVTSSNLVTSPKKYNSTFLTTASDMTKQTAYKKAQTVTVQVSKSGYATQKVTVVIKNKTNGTTNKQNTVKNTTKATTGKFSIVSNGNNCYTVTAPNAAINWRLHVYYKDANKKYFGSRTKITDLSKNHYNDGVKTQKVCFTKQKYDKETFRILVKWTDGAKDVALGEPRDWRPTGWYYNVLTDWAYKDYTVNW